MVRRRTWPPKQASYLPGRISPSGQCLVFGRVKEVAHRGASSGNPGLPEANTAKGKVTDPFDADNDDDGFQIDAPTAALVEMLASELGTSFDEVAREALLRGLSAHFGKN
jgi:hypothetical protein